MPDLVLWIIAISSSFFSLAFLAPGLFLALFALSLSLTPRALPHVTLYPILYLSTYFYSFLLRLYAPCPFLAPSHLLFVFTCWCWTYFVVLKESFKRFSPNSVPIPAYTTPRPYFSHLRAISPLSLAPIPYSAQPALHPASPNAWTVGIRYILLRSLSIYLSQLITKMLFFPLPTCCAFFVTFE